MQIPFSANSQLASDLKLAYEKIKPDLEKAAELYRRERQAELDAAEKKGFNEGLNACSKEIEIANTSLKQLVSDTTNIRTSLNATEVTIAALQERNSELGAKNSEQDRHLEALEKTANSVERNLTAHLTDSTNQANNFALKVDVNAGFDTLSGQQEDQGQKLDAISKQLTQLISSFGDFSQRVDNSLTQLEERVKKIEDTLPK